MNYIICHYNEIGLKGKNRIFFENQLVKNIKQALLSTYFNSVKRISGRILIELTELGIKNQKKVSASLSNVFGIANFSFALNAKQEIGAIKEVVGIILKGKKFKTFRATAKKSIQNFPLSSQQINEEIGDFILRNFKTKVKLKNPALTCFIEIVEGYSFVYLKKIQGLSGLPVGTGSTAALLLSGGIDSPVAGFQMMKRGVKLVFIHFHAYPYTNKASIEKIEALIEILNKFQFSSTLYLVPFDKIQKEILLKTPEKFRVILYRRMMMKIAEKLAAKASAVTLVTGESIGQVASQTLENIKTIEEAVKIPILRPLISYNKEEIIAQAEKIGTFATSIIPHDDCCARFLPKHPATRTNIPEVKEVEKKLAVAKLVAEAVRETEIKIN